MRLLNISPEDWARLSDVRHVMYEHALACVVLVKCAIEADLSHFSEFEARVEEFLEDLRRVREKADSSTALGFALHARAWTRAQIAYRITQQIRPELQRAKAAAIRGGESSNRELDALCTAINDIVDDVATGGGFFRGSTLWNIAFGAFDLIPVRLTRAHVSAALRRPPSRGAAYLAGEAVGVAEHTARFGRVRKR